MEKCKISVYSKYICVSLYIILQFTYCLILLNNVWLCKCLLIFLLDYSLIFGIFHYEIVKKTVIYFAKYMYYTCIYIYICIIERYINIYIVLCKASACCELNPDWFLYLSIHLSIYLSISIYLIIFFSYLSIYLLAELYICFGSLTSALWLSIYRYHFW